MLLVVGLAAVALAMWLFRDRVGLVANAIGWPVLACGFAMLVFAGAGARSWIARWRVPGAGWLAAVSYSLYAGAQADLSPRPRRCSGGGCRGIHGLRSRPAWAPGCWAARYCNTRSSGRFCFGAIDSSARTPHTPRPRPSRLPCRLLPATRTARTSMRCAHCPEKSAGAETGTVSRDTCLNNLLFEGKPRLCRGLPMGSTPDPVRGKLYAAVALEAPLPPGEGLG